MPKPFRATDVDCGPGGLGLELRPDAPKLLEMFLSPPDTFTFAQKPVYLIKTFKRLAPDRLCISGAHSQTSIDPD